MTSGSCLDPLRELVPAHLYGAPTYMVPTYMVPDGQYFPVDHDETIQIPGRSLALTDDGGYEIRIVEELREVAFLDEIRLIAVDHPARIDVFTNDKFKGPPFPYASIWCQTFLNSTFLNSSKISQLSGEKPFLALLAAWLTIYIYISRSFSWICTDICRPLVSLRGGVVHNN